MQFIAQVFVDDDVDVSDEFKNKAPVGLVDFADAPAAAQEINQFVSGSTKGLIPKVIDAQSLDPTTVMSIVNALYFKGEWELKFDSSRNERGEFTRADGTTKKVTYMIQNAEFKLAQTSEPAGLVIQAFCRP